MKNELQLVIMEFERPWYHITTSKTTLASPKILMVILAGS